LPLEQPHLLLWDVGYVNGVILVYVLGGLPLKSLSLDGVWMLSRQPKVCLILFLLGVWN